MYKPLHEILSALDAQQRQELAEACALVEEEELRRARDAKKQLSEVAVFFIERSWERIAPALEAFALEAQCGKSPEELRDYLARLRRRQPAFAWGWMRARMNGALMQSLEVCVPDLLLQHPEMAARYAECLGKVDSSYWFRATPLHHLKAGYHTALGVACKWYGSALELQQDAPASCAHIISRFPHELRRFASFSLTMLTRTDRYLWDSAGAEPLEAVIEKGTLQIMHREVESLCLATAPDYGIRLGCPALRARNETRLPVFEGIVNWVEQVFVRYLPVLD